MIDIYEHASSKGLVGETIRISLNFSVVKETRLNSVKLEIEKGDDVLRLMN